MFTKTSLCNGCPRYTQNGIAGVGTRPCDIFFLATAPTETVLNNGVVFGDRAGGIVTQALTELSKESIGYKNITKYFAYSVRCGSDKPDKDSLDKCRPIVQQEILMARPKIIMPMGNEALKALNITGAIKHFAGKELTTMIAGQKYIVIPTLHPYTIIKEPGLYSAFFADVRRAANRILMGDEVVNSPERFKELTKDYVIPQTIEEVENLCDQINAYGEDPDKWLISVDIETNTLYPQRQDAKVIMVSFAWDKGKACAVTLDHKNGLYDRDRAIAAVRKVLYGPKPKTYHNGKFDIKFLTKLFGAQPTNLAWDTMLGEHLLDEGKKGYYGLKILTASYAPGYAGYESKVKEALRLDITSLNSEESDDENDIPNGTAGNRVEVAGTTSVRGKRLDLYNAQELLDLLTVIKEDTKLVKKNISSIVRKIKKNKATPDEVVSHADFVKTLAVNLHELDLVKEAIKSAKSAQRKVTEKGSDNFEDIPIDVLLRYAAVDADITRQITKAQVNKFTPGLFRVMNEYAIPATTTLADMELAGFKVDQHHLDFLEKEFTKKIEEYREKIISLAGKEFNLNSGRELGNVLFMDFGLPIKAKSEKTGMAKMDKEALNDLLVDPDVDKESKELVRAVLDYRECTKAKTGFIRGPTGIYELSRDTGKMHTQFLINGTTTGRLSSSRKNMQNLKEEMHGLNMKKIFVPDNEDEVIFNMDFTGAELRALSAYARDPDLIDNLSKKDEDIHGFFTAKISAATEKDPENVIKYRDVILVRMSDEDASKLSLAEKERRDFLFKTGKNKVYTKARKDAKRVVFGTLFGMTKVRLAVDLGIDEDAAQDIIDGLMKAFPLIEKYILQTKLEVQRQGYVETLIGRRRRFPLRGIPSMVNASVREAVNFKIQSTSSDIVIGQLAEVSREILKLGGRTRITVHDSIVGTLPKKSIPLLEEFLDEWVLERVRVKYPWLPVPMLYDVEVGPSYGELEPLAKYLSGTHG